jgi:hypothetical protein
MNEEEGMMVQSKSATLFALRPIERGEELFIDYAEYHPANPRS